MIPLAVLEGIIGAPGVAGRIAGMVAAGGRAPQPAVRPLLARHGPTPAGPPPAAPARRPPAGKGRGLRRPGAPLGPPQEQPARPQRRAVLRLLLLGWHHDARGERAGRPRIRPPRHGVVLPA